MSVQTGWDEESEIYRHVMDRLAAAKGATQALASATTSQKNHALDCMAAALRDAQADILSQNRLDVRDAVAAGQSAARVDRLTLNDRRLEELAASLKAVVDLPDPIGERLDSFTRPNGLRIERVRVPMGVIAMIYEARPNVTVDAAALCIKTGNAAVLRGGRDALRTNRALVAALRRGLGESGLPVEAIQFIERVEHESVDIVLRARGWVDLAIPRGGAGLIARVVEEARVPVIETGVGNCHVYVDQAADLRKATDIVVNAKTQRPSVCNAAETLLVHEQVATAWLPEIADELVRRGVQLRVCDRAATLLQRGAGWNQGSGKNADAGDDAKAPGTVLPATEADWATEFLDLILAVRVVNGLEDAIEHIRRYGSGHSEVIVTESSGAAEQFLAAVDAAVVYHNASSRFTDGFEFGFGAEIGISTQKLHARGPMGLREMTSSKYVIHGDGQIRT